MKQLNFPNYFTYDQDLLFLCSLGRQVALEAALNEMGLDIDVLISADCPENEIQFYVNNRLEYSGRFSEDEIYVSGPGSQKNYNPFSAGPH